MCSPWQGAQTHCCCHMMLRASSTIQLLPSIPRQGFLLSMAVVAAMAIRHCSNAVLLAMLQGHNTLTQVLLGTIEVGDTASLPLQNALAINSWIELQLQDRTREERLDWVESMLETLDRHVYLTATLTTDRDMALRLFVNFNSPDSRMALDEIEVIKVVFVHQVGGGGAGAQVGGCTNHLLAAVCTPRCVSNRQSTCCVH
jgi:hypothetical protein